MRICRINRHTLLFFTALFSLIAFIIQLLIDALLSLLPFEEDIRSGLAIHMVPYIYLFYLAAILSGIYSFFESLRERKRMLQAQVNANDVSKLKTFVYVSAVGVVVSSMMLLSLLSREASLMGLIPPRHIIVNHIAQIGKDAFAFRVRSSSERGGRGSFLGYQIPMKLTKPDGLFEYNIVQPYDDSIIVIAKYLVFDTTFIMSARIETDGRPRNIRILRDTPY
jgi:hypothetical protein